MAKQLKDAAIHELSIVLSKDPETGIEFAPRNPEAMVLSVKGGEKKPSLIDRIVTRIKASMGGPVSVDVPDNVDGDGDGADDYNEICVLLGNTYSDLCVACSISDEEAKAAAICAVLDGFKEQYDAIYAGSDKAGARHSAADLESLNGIAAAHKDMAAHVAAIGGALEKLGVTGGHGPVEGEQGPEQDSGPDNSQVDDDADKAKRKDPAGKEGDEYGDVEYADTENKKYPIDTAEHVRAALSYINMPKNAKFYDADELAKIKDRIHAAAKKFGIKVSDEKAAPVEDEMKQEDVQAMIAEAIKAQQVDTDAKIEAAKAEAKAEAQASVDAAKADAAKHAELAAAYKAQSEQNAAVIAAVAGQSKGSSALSAAVTAQKSGSALADRMIQEMKINPEPTRF